MKIKFHRRGKPSPKLIKRFINEGIDTSNHYTGPPSFDASKAIGRASSIHDAFSYLMELDDESISNLKRAASGSGTAGSIKGEAGNTYIAAVERAKKVIERWESISSGDYPFDPKDLERERARWSAHVEDEGLGEEKKPSAAMWKNAK